MKKLILIMISIMTLLAGCSSSDSRSAVEVGGKLTVYTSMYPMNFLVSEIGGDMVSLKSVVPQGTDPHDYEPSMKTIADIEKADLFIYNGAGLEPWAEKVSLELGDGKAMEASSYVELIDMDESHEEEEDDYEDEHGHGSKDPHIWLSIRNMDKIANEVREKLSALDPENSEKYRENYESLSAKFSELDKRYMDELKNRTSNTILVSHSAFGYLARDYEIEQLSVAGVSPSSEPSPRTLSRLIDASKEKNLKYIYFETLASPKSAEMISKEAELEPSVLNTVEGLTEENLARGDNYITLMEENLENIKKELLK